MANRNDDPGAPKPLFVPPPKLGGQPSDGPSLFVPVSSPVFGQWPDAPIQPATPAEDSKPVEPSKPIEPNKPGVAPPIPAKPASSSEVRAPVRARKTSTQAHSVVGEFGVPPSSDSKPSAPILDDEDDDDDEDHDGPPRARRGATRGRRSGTTADDEDLDDPERTDEDPQPIAIERLDTREPPSKPAPLPLLIGLGLAATLVVAIVVGMQDGGSEDPSTDPPKANRSDPKEPVEVPDRETQPRPPGDTRTKLGDPEPPQPDVDANPSESDTDTTASEPAETDTGNAEVDPRDPSVIPPGTPEDNVKAFMKLPVSIHDGRPLGGIGRTGIHVDAITTGREYRSGACKDEVTKFSATTDKEVSVCFRIVHDREEESVRVLWDKDGVTTRRGGVRIRDLHAYKTRAYLELRPEYVGAWRVRVVSEDDVVLAAFEFEIEK